MDKSRFYYWNLRMRVLKGNLASPPPNATGLQVNNSAYGQAFPLLYGYSDVVPKLIWASNFQVHGGGSGIFASGGKGSTTYSTNADLLLPFNGVEGISDVWYNGTWFYIFSTTQVISMPSGATAGQVVPFTLTNPAQIALVAGIYLAGVPYSESYTDYVYPDENNSFTVSGNGIIPLYNAAFPAPNNGNWSSLGIPYAEYNQPGTGPTAGTVTFPAAISGSFSIVIVYYFNVNVSGFALPLPSAQLTFESELGNGASGQPIVYPEFAGAYGENINLGGSPMLPQWRLHAKGLFGLGFPVTQGTGVPGATAQTVQQMPAAGDCNPADVMFDLISSGNAVTWFGTNACWNHGCGFSGVVYDSGGGIDNQFQYSRYGSLAIDETGPIAFLRLRNYCLAYSILISAELRDQSSCAQILKDLAEIANCAPCYNGASLDFVPYCEISNFGNGANYIPYTAAGPFFALTRAHFLTTKKDKQGNSNPRPPVVLQAGLPQDNYNSLQINFKDRTGTSNNNSLIITDSGDLTRQGPLPTKSLSWPWVQTPSIAANAAWAVMRRNAVIGRDGKYIFSLPAYWSPILTLMDFITLNEPSLDPLLPIPVRITKISENEKDFTLDIEAEKYVYGGSLPTAPASGVGSVGTGGGGGGGGGQDNPGSVNPPIFIETTPEMVPLQEIWICVSGGKPIINGIESATKVSGGANYAAANVSVSGTGTGCTMIAVISGGSISNLVITNPGQNYTGTPTITITDPTGLGSGASFTAVIQASIPVSYGGCLVYMSTDGGTTYAAVDDVYRSSPIISGSQTMGVTYSADYPLVVDPDNTDTLHVDLTESQQPLSAFTSGQQNAFLSLCYLAGGGTVENPCNTALLTIPYELVAYGGATLAATNKYTLAPPIRRGCYVTPVADHPIATPFSFLNDGKVFKMALSPSLVGVTLYFKFLAFNTANTLTQTLAQATAYSFTPTGTVGWPICTVGGGTPTISVVNKGAFDLCVTPRTTGNIPLSLTLGWTPTPGNTLVFLVQCLAQQDSFHTLVYPTVGFAALQDGYANPFLNISPATQNGTYIDPVSSCYCQIFAQAWWEQYCSNSTTLNFTLTGVPATINNACGIRFLVEVYEITPSCIPDVAGATSHTVPASTTANFNGPSLSGTGSEDFYAVGFLVNIDPSNLTTGTPWIAGPTTPGYVLTSYLISSGIQQAVFTPSSYPFATLVVISGVTFKIP
jgi:hypothetical protein